MGALGCESPAPSSLWGPRGGPGQGLEQVTAAGELLWAREESHLQISSGCLDVFTASKQGQPPSKPNEKHRKGDWLLKRESLPKLASTAARMDGFLPISGLNTKTKSKTN